MNLELLQILRRQGIQDRRKVRPQILALLQELLAIVEQLHLLGPAVVYELHAITEVDPAGLRLEEGALLTGPLLPSLLGLARELAVVVCTIGPRLEEKVADYFAKSDPLRAVLLDGLGSAAVDALAQEACWLIRREAAPRGYEASSPLSPGMQGFPISEQRWLFQLVPAEQIGVRLTSTVMMVPRKSTSMVIGLGPGMPTWTQAEVCKRCPLKEICRYRVQPQTATDPRRI